MPFNLRAKRAKRPIDKLRSLDDELSRLRHSDLDGMSDEEMNSLFRSVSTAAASKETKTAVHGAGDGWIPVADPYKADPRTTGVPQNGGRWRDDIGSGTQLIDGTRTPDANPVVPVSLDEILSPMHKDEYLVRLRLPEDQEPSEGKAKEVFGEDGRADGRSIYVVVNDFENAMKIQRDVPQAVIERRMQ
jgi:hypothetical protein